MPPIPITPEKPNHIQTYISQIQYYEQLLISVYELKRMEQGCICFLLHQKNMRERERERVSGGFL